MNVVLEVTPEQARLIEDALIAKGGRDTTSAYLRAQITALLSEIRTAKTNRAA